MRKPMKINEAAGPAYPPKSSTLVANVEENFDKTSVVSMTTSVGDIFSWRHNNNYNQMNRLVWGGIGASSPVLCWII